VFVPDVFEDDRGFFKETWSDPKYAAEAGFEMRWAQDSCSWSTRNVLRGLHFDFAMAKLVQCVKGRIWDAIVDLRRDSPTYLQWQGFVLTDRNHKQLYVPAGFGHGFLALDDEDLREAPQEERRRRLERVLAKARPPVYLTPATRDRSVAQDWFSRFEGAGLDGVIAKELDAAYQPGRRAMLKIKHVRSADCVVAGFRWHKVGEGVVGSLLLGLYDERGVLQLSGSAADDDPAWAEVRPLMVPDALPVLPG